MNLLKILLISFIICAAFFLNENTFWNQTNKFQKESIIKNQKIIYRFLRNNSIIVLKNRKMNPYVYRMLGRFGKKRSDHQLNL